MKSRYHVNFNPEMDARARDELVIADFVKTRLEGKLIGLMVGSSDPHVKPGFLGIGIALWPWQRKNYEAKKAWIIEGIKEVLREDEGLRVEITALAFRESMMFWSLKRSEGPKQGFVVYEKIYEITGDHMLRLKHYVARIKDDNLGLEERKALGDFLGELVQYADAHQREEPEETIT